MTEPRSWDLLVDGERPLPMNAYRRLHYRQRADYDRGWRESFAWVARAKKVPHLDAAIVTVAQTCKRPPLPDVGASFPTAKAAIDGLVDAGVLDDDDPTRLLAITFVAPVRGTVDRFALIVEEAHP